MLTLSPSPEAVGRFYNPLSTVFWSGGVPGADSGVTPEVQYSLSTVTGSNSTLVALVG